MLVLRGGRVLDPSQGLDDRLDVVIERGRITGLGRGAAPSASGPDAVEPRVIDCTGRWVVPGLVDLRAHIGEPGIEYKEDIASGLAAAAAGGFAAVCSMPDTLPVNDTRTTTELVISQAARIKGPRLHPFAAMTVGLEGRELTEMADLREAGVIGVTDADRSVMHAGVMRSVLEYARTYDLLVAHHCEDRQLAGGGQMHEGAYSTRLGLRGIPRQAEDVVLARDLALVELTRARYHAAHLSSAGAVTLLRRAKEAGLPVSAEVSPLHLLLTDAALVHFDSLLKLSPPLRAEEDRAALREALRDGTIDCVATSHRPQSPVEKDCEFDAAEAGAIGLETALPLMLELVREQVLTPLRMVECLSTAPCRVARLDGGSLRVGSTADVTVLDPDHPWKLEAGALRSRSHNTPLLGRTLRGAATTTIVEGKVVFDRSAAAAPPAP